MNKVGITLFIYLIVIVTFAQNKPLLKLKYNQNYTPTYSEIIEMYKLLDAHYENAVVVIIPVYNIGGLLTRSAYNRANQTTPPLRNRILGKCLKPLPEPRFYKMRFGECKKFHQNISEMEA